MPRLKVIDKVGLGDLLVRAVLDESLLEKLAADPAEMLRPFVEELPPDHKIRFVIEDDNTTTIVLPPAESLPRTLAEIEEILREEAGQYDAARQRVDKSKGKRSKDEPSPIPPEVLVETYLLMIGNTALTPTSRPRRQETPRESEA